MACWPLWFTWPLLCSCLVGHSAPRTTPSLALATCVCLCMHLCMPLCIYVSVCRLSLATCAYIHKYIHKYTNTQTHLRTNTYIASIHARLSLATWSLERAGAQTRVRTPSTCMYSRTYMPICKTAHLICLHACKYARSVLTWSPWNPKLK